MCPLAVLLSQRGPAVPRVPQPGSRSPWGEECSGEQRAPVLVLGAHSCLPAVGGVGAMLQSFWQLLAAGEHSLDTAPTGRCPLSPAPGVCHQGGWSLGDRLAAPGAAAVPWAQPASSWLGRLLLLQKMGLHPAQEKSKMAFLEGRRTTGPGRLHCAPAKAAGGAACWGL